MDLVFSINRASYTMLGKTSRYTLEDSIHVSVKGRM